MLLFFNVGICQLLIVYHVEWSIIGKLNILSYLISYLRKIIDSVAFSRINRKIDVVAISLNLHVGNIYHLLFKIVIN